MSAKTPEQAGTIRGQVISEVAKFGGMSKEDASRLARILLPLIEQEVTKARIDELSHLGFDKRLDNPILSCLDERALGAITLEERIAQLKAGDAD